MTNTKLLKDKIDESGVKLKFIAEKLDLTYSGLRKKINNSTEFKASEIAELSKILELNKNEVMSIFFGNFSH